MRKHEDIHPPGSQRLPGKAEWAGMGEAVQAEEGVGRHGRCVQRMVEAGAGATGPVFQVVLGCISNLPHAGEQFSELGLFFLQLNYISSSRESYFLLIWPSSLSACYSP